MRLLLALFCGLCLWAVPAGAAPREFGHTVPEDFAYQQLALGETVAQMRQVLGEELFDTDRNVFNLHMKYYTYKKFVIGVEADTGVVRDIVIKDEDFRLRDDVCRGATAYKIFMTYGRAERQPVDGKTCYVYENKLRPRERLLLEIDAGGTNALERVRITSLPLTLEEAQQESSSRPWQGNTLEDWERRSKEAAGGQRDSSGRAQITYHYEVNKGV